MRSIEVVELESSTCLLLVRELVEGVKAMAPRTHRTRTMRVARNMAGGWELVTMNVGKQEGRQPAADSMLTEQGVAAAHHSGDSSEGRSLLWPLLPSKADVTRNPATHPTPGFGAQILQLQIWDPTGMFGAMELLYSPLPCPLEYCAHYLIVDKI